MSLYKSQNNLHCAENRENSIKQIQFSLLTFNEMSKWEEVDCISTKEPQSVSICFTCQLNTSGNSTNFHTLPFFFIFSFHLLIYFIHIQPFSYTISVYKMYIHTFWRLYTIDIVMYCCVYEIFSLSLFLLWISFVLAGYLGKMGLVWGEIEGWPTPYPLVTPLYRI